MKGYARQHASGVSFPDPPTAPAFRQMDALLSKLKRMVALETPHVPLTAIKEISGKGEFSGYASVAGVLDAYNEKVLAGAFTETLKERGPQFPLLWSHRVEEPIGSVKAQEDSIGLRVQGQLDMEIERAREVFSLIKGGTVTGLSIGFISQEWKWDEEVRVITRLKLYEISAVVFPANDSARITGAKSYAYQHRGEAIETRMLVA